MKKLLTKIALSIIISINLMVIFGAVAYASDPLQNTKILDEAKKIPCISDDDIGKIVTFIEEPIFEVEGDSPETHEGESYKIINCYRHTLSWKTDKKVERTDTALSKGDCSSISQSIPPDTKYSCYPVQAIISDGGTTMLYHYIGTIYKWAAGFVGIISVTVVIISGAQISAAGGDTQTIDEAKKRIVQSLSGIALLFLSALILNTINPTFFT